MTKSLIVNCSLSRQAKIEELARSIRKFSECIVVPYRDIHTDYKIEKDVDVVVLSGSKARIIDPSHRAKFEDVVNLIKHLDLPVLGICYGHQLLCWALGCKVDCLATPVLDRFEEVRVAQADHIFSSYRKHQSVLLAESHYDHIIRSSLHAAGFILLADSDSCEVEAVKHERKPLYGVQFHPERISIGDHVSLEGHKVIENFYQNVVKQ